ncbi:MAG: ABC transporter permease subunit [Clostridiales bacterium]|nr:ABC transporter permease subunit [Clostridiales bacterium]
MNSGFERRQAPSPAPRGPSAGARRLGALRKDLPFYLMLAPAVVWVFVFQYIPMPGVVMAFKDYDIIKGIFASPWAGLKHIANIAKVPMLREAVFNTLWLNVVALGVCFTLPIIFALLLNEIRNSLFKRVVQTLSYLPYFLSWISIIAICYTVYSLDGIINDMRVLFGAADRIMFLARGSFFAPNYIILTLWHGLGWSSIIFIAAIAGVDAELYEAAILDGATRFQQAMRVTLPSIAPTIVIMLIFNIGGLLGSNFELVYGLQNAFIDFEVISTVLFKSGIQQGNYSMATAVGLMQGLITFLLTAAANQISKKVRDVSLW